MRPRESLRTSQGVGEPLRLDAGSGRCEQPHYDLELLYSELKFDEVTRLCRERLVSSPDDLTLHWMLIRALYERGEQFPRTDDSVDKKAIYQEMIDLSEHGLELSPEDPHLLFARGLALGRMGTHRGVLASLFSVKEIEQVWVKAAVSGYQYASIYGNEQMPCDVYLGLVCFTAWSQIGGLSSCSLAHEGPCRSRLTGWRGRISVHRVRFVISRNWACRTCARATKPVTQT